MDGDRVADDSEQELIDRARVDVAKVCGDRAGRARVYAILRQVDAWGLLRQIAPYIRVEKGAMLRGLRVDEGVLDDCYAAVGTGLLLYNDLVALVSRVVRGGPQFVNIATEPTAYEKIVLGALQRWLDALAKSLVPMHPLALETIAGFAGCDVEGLRRFRASTGVEAALQIAWSIRHAIAGEIPHPFAWLGLFDGERRRALPATGRKYVSDPLEMAWDDRAILFAVAEGAKSAKTIYAKLREAGVKLTYVRVRQRKKDLVSWQLLQAKDGVWCLSEKGEALVRVLRADSAPTAT